MQMGFTGATKGGCGGRETLIKCKPILMNIIRDYYNSKKWMGSVIGQECDRGRLRDFSVGLAIFMFFTGIFSMLIVKSLFKHLQHCLGVLTGYSALW